MVERVLVVGASGALGGVIAARLVAGGASVRGMTRDAARLADLAAQGAEVVEGDLLQPATLVTACEGVGQIVSTANSFSGVGANSPTRVDVPGYRNLLHAARRAGVRRIVHVSAVNIDRTSAVDFFRVKAEIDDVIRQSGVPFVLLRASAFLDVWVGLVLAEVNAGRPARIFGDGRRVANYIAIDDVARFVARIVAAPEVTNQQVDIGGPSTLSQNELVDRIAEAIGRPIARQHLPLPALRIGAVVLRPFNEMLARLMALGAWSAGADRRLDHWKAAADRFGVQPISAEAFLAGVRRRSSSSP